MKELERYVRPEFIGRLDDVIVFRPLGPVHMGAVVELELKKVTKRSARARPPGRAHAGSEDFLIEKGHQRRLGARPLRRAIEQFVEDPLSEDILRGASRARTSSA